MMGIHSLKPFRATAGGFLRPSRNDSTQDILEQLANDFEMVLTVKIEVQKSCQYNLAQSRWFGALLSLGTSTVSSEQQPSGDRDDKQFMAPNCGNQEVQSLL